MPLPGGILGKIYQHEENDYVCKGKFCKIVYRHYERLSVHYYEKSGTREPYLAYNHFPYANIRAYSIKS